MARIRRFAPARAPSYCFVSVVVVDEPAGVFVVVVELEDSLLGGLTMVVSFFSPGGFTTVVLLSPGGTLTRVSQAVSASASVAQRIIDFIVVYFSWPALPYRVCRHTLIRHKSKLRLCNSVYGMELHIFSVTTTGQCSHRPLRERS